MLLSWELSPCQAAMQNLHGSIRRERVILIGRDLRRWGFMCIQIKILKESYLNMQCLSTHFFTIHWLIAGTKHYLAS